MALWHMDRARYYASVRDDARALRHLSMFGDVDRNQRSDMRGYEAKIRAEGENIDKQETKRKGEVSLQDKACPVLAKELKDCKKEITKKDAAYKTLSDRFNTRAALPPDERGRSEIERLSGVVESLQADKARAEAVARKSEEAPAQGGCSVM